MEALIGITGHDFVLLAADRVSARSIVVMKSSESKFRDLSKTISLAYSGEPGDAVQFAEYIQRNVQLYEIRNELPLNTNAAAHFTRRQLADSLRSRTPYAVNLLVGGCDKRGCDRPTERGDGPTGPDGQDRPKLYWIDHLAAMTRVPFAAHGYASYFVLSLMDRYYRPDLTADEAIALLKQCLAELKTRFIVSLPDFTVKIVRSSGIEELVLSL